MFRISKYIPGMFHRRVLLLAVLAVGSFGLLVVRLGAMTLGEGGEQARIDAGKRLVRTTWLPTVRGTIYDRKGRVLAGDRASYDIAVDYRVLAGQWVYSDRSGKLHGIDIDRYAARLAKRYNDAVWDKLEESQRDELIAGFDSALRARVDAMYQYISEQTGTPVQELLDRRDEIVRRVKLVKAEYTERTRERELRRHAERGHVPNQADLDRVERIAARPIEAEEEAHPLVEDVSDAMGFAFVRQSARSTALVQVDGQEHNEMHTPVSALPGLTVLDATARLYPYKTVQLQIERSSFPPPLQSEAFVILEETDVGSMILGSVRPGIQLDDVQRRAAAVEGDPVLALRSLTEKGTDRGRYMHGDRIGRSGIERAYEDQLRGLRGVSVENRQTGEAIEIGSTAGLDVQLTLDIMLQARVRAILDPKLGLARVQAWHQNEEPTTPIGTELDAGVIVLEVATGEILALVSTPVPPSDGDWTRFGVRTDEDKRRFDKIHTPFINRAIAMPYPPGSVAKAVILAGAAKYGKYTQGERIEATGHLLPNQPNKYRSWIFKQHGITHFDQIERNPDGVDALMVSSNVFFFTLGQRLEAEGITDIYRSFGVGTRYDLGIGYEWGGSIGALSGKSDGKDLSHDDAILMGIGQGPVTWTPLHAADAFATLARQGVRIPPKLVRDGRAPKVSQIDLPSWAVRDALEGLHKVVTDVEFGTGRAIRYEEFGPESVPIFNAPGISLWGKTGTATAPSIVYDPDRIGDEDGPLEPIVVRKGDHSWFVTLVGREGGSPEYAIAVVADYAGSGGKVSGPINNQVIHALIDEGYLPDARHVQPARNEQAGASR